MGPHNAAIGERWTAMDDTTVTGRVKSDPAHIEPLITDGRRLGDWTGLGDRRDGLTVAVDGDVKRGYVVDVSEGRMLQQRWRFFLRPDQGQIQSTTAVTWAVDGSPGQRTVLPFGWRLPGQTRDPSHWMKDGLLRLKVTAEAAFHPSTMLCAACKHVWEWHTLGVALEVYGQAPEIEFAADVDVWVFGEAVLREEPPATVREPSCWFDAPWIKLPCTCPAFRPARVARREELCTMCGARVASGKKDLCAICRQWATDVAP
jgi:hypothetical protein